MGTSLLAMAWGINQSGLFSGILINILVAAICLYTAYTILKINEKHGMYSFVSIHYIDDTYEKWYEMHFSLVTVFLENLFFFSMCKDDNKLIRNIV